jgi:pimeloyl-ACP methyl ester carboxylesterase
MRNRNRRHYGFITFILLTVFVCSHAIAQAPFTEREVSFQNDSVELSGTLLLPHVQGRSPAVVFLHGSGPMTRAGFRPYAEEFAKLGVASLFFDKRGTGSSGGSWLTSSLDDLAGDALAAIQYLKTEERIDPGRIGFWGISQAGWVAPLVASQSKDVAFMILISGGGASPRESELFSYRKEFEKAGLSESEKSDAVRVLDMYFDYLTTGEGRSRLIAGLDSIRASRLKPLAEQLDRIIPSEENRRNWSWVGAYEHVHDIEKVKCPVLLMFGDRDAEHPTELAVERWREGLKKAGNDEVTIKIFPGAGHGIRMREGYTGKGRAPFADGYEEVQLGWLWRHVVDSK